MSVISNNLGKMGRELTDKECLELEKYLPVDADGKVYLDRLMDGVKTLKGGIVDVHKLDTVLQNMGMKLTKSESKDLIKNLPVDGGMVKVNNLDNVLENLGIELTEKEQEDLIENLPLDVHGNVDLDKLMDGVKALTGREINVSDVEYVLENMGIELTGKEWLKLLKHLPIDADGKIYQNRLMDGMTSLRVLKFVIKKL
ncbi:calmodulin-beta-like [Hippopotamus amphibius kiboko]|uniref:calmodulin-beta-like n=1 Tax=Hippopotamus amphibius kiboko TaxID=575201 RepID=UPI0025941172|nr:calmodulin-beta-like [Hippopotamus amphibius kiboko]